MSVSAQVCNYPVPRVSRQLLPYNNLQNKFLAFIQQKN